MTEPVEKKEECTKDAGCTSDSVACSKNSDCASAAVGDIVAESRSNETTGAEAEVKAEDAPIATE